MKQIPPWLNTPLPIVPAISKLEKWITSLQAQETVRPTLKTKIHFANKTPTRTQRVYLYIHGLGASVNELEPLVSSLAKKYKANIVYQRTYRHGISLAPLEYLTPKLWYYSALQGLAIANKIGKEVIVISCSTGGTLSLLLSARKSSHREMLHQVLISPNCWPSPKWICKLFLVPGVYRILENIPRLYVGSKHRFIKAETMLQQCNMTVRSPMQALRPMMQLVRLIWTIREKSNPSYTTPTTIIANPNDTTVLFSMTKKFFKKHPFPYNLEIYQSPDLEDPHVLAGTMYSPNTTKDIAQIINNHTKIIATGHIAP